MPAASFGLSRIGQIAVVVHDIDRATAFYRDVLGMKLISTVQGLAFFNAGGVRLMLSLPENQEFDHPGSILYFDVPDLDDAYRTLQRRGVRFVEEPHFVAHVTNGDLWMAFFTDLDDNVMAIMSERPRG